MKSGQNNTPRGVLVLENNHIWLDGEVWNTAIDTTPEEEELKKWIMEIRK